MKPPGGLPVPGSRDPPADFGARLDGARDVVVLFDLVKDLVERRLGKSRGGIMLGLTELGAAPGAFIGGYFVVGSNAIVLNRTVLRLVQGRHPTYYNAYAFHVLLHEYLHTLGYFSEAEVRPLALRLTREALGGNHPATRIAAALAGAGGSAVPEFFGSLVYPDVGWAPERPAPIEIVKGFDPGSTPYIG